MKHEGAAGLLLRSALVLTLLLLACAASSVAAQGVNARYLPFPESRLKKFPLKRHEFPPNVPVNGQPFTVAGVTLRDGEFEVSGAAAGVEEVGRRLVISGRGKDGREWRFDTEPHMHYDAVYEGDLDGNGARDVVVALGTGANGLGPPTHLIFLTFGRDGRPELFEVSGYFDARREDIYDLTDLDGDGRAELLYMVFDDGYWITELYRPREARWERVAGRFAGLTFPLYTRFTNRPNHTPVRPTAGREPRAPDLIEENRQNRQRGQAGQTQNAAPDLAAVVDVADGCIPFEELYGVEIIEDEQALAARLARTAEWCKEKVPSIDFALRTLVGVRVRAGSCPAGRLFRHEFVRDDARRLYLVTLRGGRNPCRGLGAYELWLSVPKLPAGYKVEHEVKYTPDEDGAY